MTELAVIDLDAGLPSLPDLPDLPELPVHYNPIKALSAAKREELLDAILSHYENGASIYELATKLGINSNSLYRNLKKYRLDEWREVASAYYEGEIAEAEKELKEARSSLVVSRAREVIASARWKLERLDRRIYGQDQPANLGQAVQININLRGEPATNASQQVELSTDIKLPTE